jgi:hypothetical protein
MSCCELRETEIENLDAAGTAEEQIVGLEITEDDAFVVGGAKPYAICAA